MKYLIGFCGRARHGKDFVAQTVRNELENAGYKCFMSSISEVVLSDAQSKGLIPSNIRREQCVRRELDILVRHGHEGRKIHLDHWINELEQQIIEFNPDVALVPGVRFPNEISWIKDNRPVINGIVVRVHRYNADGSDYISPDRDPNDPMETILNRVVADYEISATTGQEKWLTVQAQAFAKYIVQERS